MKKSKLKTKPSKTTIRKVRIPKRNFYLLFWTVLLFILSLPVLLFVQSRQDIRQRAAASACIPAGGTCKPAGNCGAAETDAGEKDCSSDGTLTCCVPQSTGCLGGTSCNPTPTQQPIAPSPVIPTDTPMFNGFVAPSTTIINAPTQTPMPANQQLIDTPTAAPSETLSTTPNLSTAPSTILPSLSVAPGSSGTIGNNLLSTLLDFIKKIFELLLSLISGGHHSGGNTGGHHHGGRDRD